MHVSAIVFHRSLDYIQSQTCTPDFSIYKTLFKYVLLYFVWDSNAIIGDPYFTIFAPSTYLYIYSISFSMIYCVTYDVIYDRILFELIASYTGE